VNVPRLGRPRSLPTHGWLVLCLIFCQLAQAQTHPPRHEILLLLSGDGRPYQELALALEASLGPSERRRLRLRIQEVKHLSAPPQGELVITAGLRALQRALEQSDGPPVLATLIPRSSYRRAIAGSPRNTSALYIDQPPGRYLQLLKAVLPNARRVAFMTSPQNAPLERRLRHVAARLGLRLETARIESAKDLPRAIRRLFPDNDALLALADPTVYNRYTLKNILLASYRHSLPVIAYSRSFVRAGALAAVYTTPSQLGLQLAELLSQWLVDPSELPAPRHPDYFLVEVNRPLAQSLGLSLPHDAVLMDRLTRFPGEGP